MHADPKSPILFDRPNLDSNGTIKPNATWCNITLGKIIVSQTQYNEDFGRFPAISLWLGFVYNEPLL